jgi:uncharacterized protein YkwD
MVRHRAAKVTGARLRRGVALLALSCAVSVAVAAGGTLEVIQSLRTGACPGTRAPALRHERRLDLAASLRAQGLSATQAFERSDYVADASALLHISGPAASFRQALRSSGCQTLMRRELRDVGSYHLGAETWIMLAAPYLAPTLAQQPTIAARALELVNAARRLHQRCGRRDFDAAPPLRRSAALDAIAFAHARDMAEHGYFDHQDRSGHSPAQRVRSAGYREQLVGENIAYGPGSAAEVVRGWLASAEHCENLMNPGFREMGLAYAPGRTAGRRALYWVQLLADPAQRQR